MHIETILRWTARIWGIATFLVIIAFVAGGAESMRPTASEAVGLLLFPVGTLVGLALAWWREGLGGLVTVASLALFYVWIVIRGGHIPSSPYFLLLAAPGFLHLVNAFLVKPRSAAAA